MSTLPRTLCSLALALLTLVGCADPSGADGAADDAAPRTPRVVLLTQSKGYEHGVVKRAAPGKPSLVERALRDRWAGRADVTLLRDAARLDAARLADTDVLVMYTTGELPIPGGAAALVAWVRGGGALLGVHSVSDTFHEQPVFLDMLGGEFDGHPWHQPVRALVVDREHPATASLGESMELHDEIYEYKGRASADLDVLLRLDPSSVDMSKAKHPDSGHPLSWVREPGEGRVFHTGLGHRDELWVREEFLSHLDGALEWLLSAE